MVMRMLFPALIPAMALAGAIAVARGDAIDAAAQAAARAISDQQVSAMKIRMDVEGTAITATLVDNESSRDFVSLLPLALTLTDYAGTEKIGDLPRRLSTEGAPAGSNPSVGDIAHYAPWGNLAIFYSDFGYSRGLIQLGKIDSGVEVFSGSNPVRVTIELIEEQQS
jgi:hypothetical protein